MTSKNRRAIFDWPPSRERGTGAGTRRAQSLGERLRETVQDRVSPADALVAESAEITWGWLRERPADWSHEDVARELESGLSEWARAHDWRGPAALWIDALRRAALWSRGPGRPAVRQALLDELSHWIPSSETEAEDVAWDGTPLSAGRRMPRRIDLVPRVLPALEEGECILVHGFSETIALVLEAAHDAGLDPEVRLTEGGPELGGKRLSQRLAGCGLRIRLGYDLAWLGDLASCDRVWVGTEAIGAGRFIGRVGTRLLFEEAERHGVAREVLATSDKLTPGGRAELPSWGEQEPWILWSDPPPGVQLERQPYEALPLGSIDAFWTEAGRETVSELFVRAQPPEPVASFAPPEAAKPLRSV